MAKNKNKKSRRQGMFSKAINASLIALGFADPIVIMLGPGTLKAKVDHIINDATFGLVRFDGSKSKFNLASGLAMYTPGGAAIGLGKLKQYLMRHFPVR